VPCRTRGAHKERSCWYLQSEYSAGALSKKGYWHGIKLENISEGAELSHVKGLRNLSEMKAHEKSEEMALRSVSPLSQEKSRSATAT
jgi:hypothetical protein